MKIIYWNYGVPRLSLSVMGGCSVLYSLILLSLRRTGFQPYTNLHKPCASLCFATIIVFFMLNVNLWKCRVLSNRVKRTIPKQQFIKDTDHEKEINDMRNRLRRRGGRRSAWSAAQSAEAAGGEQPTRQSSDGGVFFTRGREKSVGIRTLRGKSRGGNVPPLAR